MADNLSIALSNIQNIRTVNIEPYGVFKVRKLGAGEELDMSAKLRRLNEILKELRSFDVTPDTDEKTVLEYQNKSDKLLNEISAIKRFEYDTYRGLFEDEDGGKSVKRLFKVMDEETRAEVFRQIFQPKVVDEPELEPEVEQTNG